MFSQESTLRYRRRFSSEDLGAAQDASHSGRRAQISTAEPKQLSQELSGPEAPTHNRAIAGGLARGDKPHPMGGPTPSQPSVMGWLSTLVAPPARAPAPPNADDIKLKLLCDQLCHAHQMVDDPKIQRGLMLTALRQGTSLKFWKLRYDESSGYGKEGLDIIRDHLLPFLSDFSRGRQAFARSPILALEAAIHLKQSGAATALVALGCPVDFKTGGKDVIDLAMDCHDLISLRYLINHETHYADTILMRAIKNNCPEALEEFLRVSNSTGWGCGPLLTGCAVNNNLPQVLPFVARHAPHLIEMTLEIKHDYRRLEDKPPNYEKAYRLALPAALLGLRPAEALTALLVAPLEKPALTVLRRSLPKDEDTCKRLAAYVLQSRDERAMSVLRQAGFAFT